MISSQLSLAVVVADIAIAAVLVAGVAYAARGRPAAQLAGGAAVAAWFGLALVLADRGFYETTPDSAVPPRIVLGIMLPTLIACALLTLAPVRRAITRVPLHWLVGVQAYRVVGALFLVAWLQDDMPAEFALPAGIGDVLIGVAAPFVALYVVRAGVARARPAVVAWCALGIADLVVAVACGFLTAPSIAQQLALDAPNTAITSYPFVLIPTFAVPASIALHVYVLARLRRARQAVAHPKIA